MVQISYSNKLWLAFWTLLMAALVIPFGWHGLNLGAEILEETRTTAFRYVDLASWMLEERGDTDSRTRNEWLARLASQLGVRITLIDQGKVVADSNLPFERLSELEDHSFREEVLAARDHGKGSSKRFSATLKLDLLYAAKLLRDDSFLPGGVLRVAIPMSSVAARKRAMLSTLLWAIPATLLVSMLASYLLSRSLWRAIDAFSKDAQRVGRHGSSDRIRIAPGIEFQPLADAINAMADSIEWQMAEIENQRGQLEALFTSMPDGVLVLDGADRVESWNRAIEGMFPGMERMEGKTLLEATMSLEAVEAARQARAAQPNRERLASSFRTPAGLVLEVQAVAFKDLKDDSKVVLVFRDATRLRRLERMRKDFVANLAHELRTPLTSIQGYVEMLQEYDEIDKNQRDAMLATIADKTKVVANTLSGIVWLSELESELLQVRLDHVDAASAARRAIERVRPKAETKAIEILTKLPDEAVMVEADQDMLISVFANLLDNAVRFSPDKGRVTVTLTQADPPVFSIEDQGPGIPRSEQGRIFERFYRTGSLPPNMTEGPGLGLAIARHSMERLHGSLSVESPIDPKAADGWGGSRFLVELRPARNDSESGEA